MRLTICTVPCISLVTVGMVGVVSVIDIRPLSGAFVVFSDILIRKMGAGAAYSRVPMYRERLRPWGARNGR